MKKIFILFLVIAFTLSFSFVRSDSGQKLFIDDWITAFADLNGIKIGTPVFYNKVKVGQVTGISPLNEYNKVVIRTITTTSLPEKMQFELVSSKPVHIEMLSLEGAGQVDGNLSGEESSPDAYLVELKKAKELLENIEKLKLEEKLGQLEPISTSLASMEMTSDQIKDLKVSLKDIKLKQAEIDELKDQLADIKNNLENIKNQLK